MITTTPGRWEFTASGSSGSFAVTSPVYDTAALDVVVRDTDTDELYTVDFTVALADDRSGATVAVAAGLTSGHKVVVYRLPVLTQLQPLSSSGPLPPRTVERQMDRLVADQQALSERVQRSVRASLADTDELLELPPAALRASQVLLFGTDGQPLVNVRAPLADDDELGDLPAAAARAGMVLGFDGDGQPTVFSNVPLSPTLAVGAWWQTTLLASTAAAARALTSLPATPSGRLAFNTGEAVLTANQSAKTVIRWVPFNGGVAPLWNATASEWRLQAVAELSNDLTASSTGKAGPAAATANKIYDLFMWDDSGTPRLTRGPAWSSDTSRGTGAGTSELDTGNGFEVNKVAITNGPAAGRGLYLGSVRTNGTGAQVDFVSATQDAGIFLTLWNRFNRARLDGYITTVNASWSYNTATLRPILGSNGFQSYVLAGLPRDTIWATYTTMAAHSAGSSVEVGMGYDSQSVSVAAINGIGTVAAGALIQLSTSLFAQPNGWHYMQPLEKGFAASGTMTWYGSGSAFNFNWSY